MSSQSPLLLHLFLFTLASSSSANAALRFPCQNKLHVEPYCQQTAGPSSPSNPLGRKACKRRGQATNVVGATWLYFSARASLFTEEGVGNYPMRFALGVLVFSEVSRESLGSVACSRSVLRMLSRMFLGSIACSWLSFCVFSKHPMYVFASWCACFGESFSEVSHAHASCYACFLGGFFRESHALIDMLICR